MNIGVSYINLISKYRARVDAEEKDLLELYDLIDVISDKHKCIGNVGNAEPIFYNVGYDFGYQSDCFIELSHLFEAVKWLVFEKSGRLDNQKVTKR